MDIGTIRYFNATVNVDKFTYKQGDKIIVKDLYVGESGVKQSSVITTKGNDNEYWYVRSLNADFTPEITENDEIVDTTTTTTTTSTTTSTTYNAYSGGGGVDCVCSCNLFQITTTVGAVTTTVAVMTLPPRTTTTTRSAITTTRPATTTTKPAVTTTMQDTSSMMSVTSTTIPAEPGIVRPMTVFTWENAVTSGGILLILAGFFVYAAKRKKP